MTKCPNPGRRRRSGQALTEIALLLPLLALLVLGIYSVSELVSTQNAATVASRNGARLAAELGKEGWQTGAPTSPAATDAKIVHTVNQGLVAPNVSGGVSVVEIDVYKPDPGQPAGYFDLADASMLIDRYNPDGTPWPGPPGAYSLDQRHDVLGNQSQIGVRVVYDYQPSAAIFGWMGGQRSAYTVMVIQPS